MRQTGSHQATPLAVFFHPDFEPPSPLRRRELPYRRLRHWTGSADLPAWAGSARGLVPEGTYRRWGIPPRPEDVGFGCAGEPARWIL